MKSKAMKLYQLGGVGLSKVLGGGGGTETIAYDASSISDILLTFSHTCSGTNRYLLVGCLGYGVEGDTITGITYGGVSMSRLGVGIGAGQSIYMYGLLNPASGINDIIVSSTGGTIYTRASSYTGVGGVGTTEVTPFAPVSTMDTSVTTTEDNSWLVGLFRSQSEQTANVGTAFRTGGSTTIVIGDSGGALSPAGEYTLGTTAGSIWMTQIVSSLEPALSSGGLGGSTYSAEFLLNNNFLDTSGNGITATNNGVTFDTTNYDSQVYSGVFNGSSYVTIGGTTTLEFTTPFFIEAQVKANAGSYFGAIVSKRGAYSGVPGYELLVRDSGVLTMLIGTGASFGYVIGTTSIKDGNWHTVKAEWTGTEIKVYVDGVVDGTAPWTEGVSYLPGYLGMIGYNGFGDFFSGNIQKVRYGLL